MSARYPQIEAEVKAVLKNLSGRNLDGMDTSATFFALGFDSLLLTQASQSFRQKFAVKISFRQLLEDLVSISRSPPTSTNTCRRINSPPSRPSRPSLRPWSRGRHRLLPWL